MSILCKNTNNRGHTSVLSTMWTRLPRQHRIRSRNQTLPPIWIKNIKIFEEKHIKGYFKKFQNFSNRQQHICFSLHKIMVLFHITGKSISKKTSIKYSFIHFLLFLKSFLIHNQHFSLLYFLKQKQSKKGNNNLWKPITSAQ